MHLSKWSPYCLFQEIMPSTILLQEGSLEYLWTHPSFSSLPQWGYPLHHYIAQTLPLLTDGYLSSVFYNLQPGSLLNCYLALSAARILILSSHFPVLNFPVVFHPFGSSFCSLAWPRRSFKVRVLLKSAGLVIPNHLQLSEWAMVSYLCGFDNLFFF